MLEVTIYAFSIENFSRPKEEVDTLFGLLRDNIKNMYEVDDSHVHKYKVKVRIIGNKSLIPEDILPDLEEVERRTDIPNYERVLNICFPYTSRDDITSSIKALSKERERNAISRDDITEQALTDHMYTGPKTLPLDLLIRTSGHNRLSDFMLWQCTTNCKVEFVETLWPNFKFLSLYFLLLKWSYERQTDINSKMVEKYRSLPKIEYVDLTSLRKPPPFASVGDR